jgi:hypothetical protein
MLLFEGPERSEAAFRASRRVCLSLWVQAEGARTATRPSSSPPRRLSRPTIRHELSLWRERSSSTHLSIRAQDVDHETEDRDVAEPLAVGGDDVPGVPASIAVSKIETQT